MMRMKPVCKTMILPVMTVLLLVLTGSAAPAAERIDLQALVAKKVPILLEFGRGWCIPCKYMKPILKDMEQAYAGKAIVTTVDMDANMDLVRAFRIRMMPTQVFLAPDGKEFHRNEGTFEREQIAQIFAKMGLVPPSRAPGQSSSAAPQPPAPRVPQQAQKRYW
jgi:thioredoxin 1